MRHYTLALAAACLLQSGIAVAAASQGTAAPPAAQDAKAPEKKEITACPPAATYSSIHAAVSACMA